MAPRAMIPGEQVRPTSVMARRRGQPQTYKVRPAFCLAVGHQSSVTRAVDSLGRHYPQRTTHAVPEQLFTRPHHRVRRAFGATVATCLRSSP